MPPLFDIPDAMAVAVISAEGAVLVAVVGLLGHLLTRVTSLENSQRELWKLREADALTKRALGDHIDALEEHIRADKGPPPPPRPAGV